MISAADTYTRARRTHLLKVAAELALEELRVPLEKGEEKIVELVDGVAVALLPHRERRVQ